MKNKNILKFTSALTQKSAIPFINAEIDGVAIGGLLNVGLPFTSPSPAFFGADSKALKINPGFLSVSVDTKDKGQKKLVDVSTKGKPLLCVFDIPGLPARLKCVVSLDGMDFGVLRFLVMPLSAVPA
jgi:hypothetical protein